MAYAITFDMDKTCLSDSYGGSYNNAYLDIGKVLNNNGFIRQQGSVYFGNENTTSVDCVIAIQQLTTQYDWFAVCVKDVRMLRIEELNDLKPAIDKIIELKRENKNY